MSSNAKRGLTSLSGNIDPERQARRLKAIDQWVEHVRSTPAPEWGAELNELINAQVESAEALSEAHDEDAPDLDGFDPEAIREAGMAAD